MKQRYASASMYVRLEIKSGMHLFMEAPFFSLTDHKTEILQPNSLAQNTREENEESLAGDTGSSHERLQYFYSLKNL